MQFPHHTSLTDLAQALRSGDLPLPVYLDTLEAYFEAREPAVLAFVPEDGRFDRLRHEAAALLARYPDPAQRPPLFGVPIGVKDIFHVDGFVTHAGSRLPVDELQGPEAASVTVLRAQGALILGKAVTTEFAYFGPGPTRNPFNPAHTPGGSSSGSAAAVGAQLAPFAFGTQTIGSIGRPAAFCGVVGYKPSHERISRAGVIPLSPSLDHIGFFVPDVADVALAAAFLARDWQPVDPQRLPVLGIPAGPYLAQAGAEAQAHFQATAVRLREAGYSVTSVPAMPDFEAIRERHLALVAADAAQVHADWYARYGTLYHPKTVALIERGKQIDLQTAGLARHGRGQLRDELTALMDSHGIDLWISPSATGAAPAGLDSTGDPVMNLPWTHAGLPTLSIPAGFNAAGLPLGLQVAARFNADEALVAWGAAIATAVDPTSGAA